MNPSRKLGGFFLLTRFVCVSFVLQGQLFRTKFSVIVPICSGILYTSGKRNHFDSDVCPTDSK